MSWPIRELKSPQVITSPLLRRTLRNWSSSRMVSKPEISEFLEEVLAGLMDGESPASEVQLIEPLGVATRQSTDVVAIDEVQFLDEEAIRICEFLADKGIRVIVSGLDREFRGEPFTFMPRLLAMAEYVTKLTAVCVKCGAPATRTQRIVNGKPAKYNDPIVLIGAEESYEARCRRCHKVYRKPKPYNEMIK